MQLTTVFEHWHLGDGNYPAFAVGQEARLSFELDVTSAELADEATHDELRQLRDAEYEVDMIRHDNERPSFSLLDLALVPEGAGPQHPTFIGA